MNCGVSWVLGRHPSEPRDLRGLRKLERVLLPTQSGSFCPVEGFWIDRILARLGLRHSWLLELLPYMHGVLASEGPIIQNVAPGAVPAISDPKTRWVTVHTSPATSVSDCVFAVKKPFLCLHCSGIFWDG